MAVFDHLQKSQDKMVDYKNSTHRKVMKAMWTKILHAEKGWLKKNAF